MVNAFDGPRRPTTWSYARTNALRQASRKVWLSDKSIASRTNDSTQPTRYNLPVAREILIFGYVAEIIHFISPIILLRGERKDTRGSMSKKGIISCNQSCLILVVMVFWSNFMVTHAEPAFTTDGSKIIDADGNEVELKGVNWFGFNNGQTMFDGLWGGPNLATDFATVVWRMKLLGFNAVRVPFSFKDFKKPPRSFLVQNCGPPTPDEVAASVTPAGTKPPRPAPPLPNPPTYEDNTCNGYLPNDSVLERFKYVVKFLADNGFYVLIDNHLREDQTALEDKDLWVQEWVDLLQDLMADPVIKDKLMVDILNEPDNYGVSWETMTDLYVSAMDAIENEVGDVLYFVEGTEQPALFVNWGDGFSTERIEELGLGDPRPFFNTILEKPYRDRVVLSPHVYPSSVTFSRNNVTGDGLFYRLTTSFGSKTKDGYCNGDDCKQFPIAIGEFGSKFQEEEDIIMMNDFAEYLNNEGKANDGQHDAIPNWFYWSWNANSGDTGGLVTDNWVTVEWNKINYLRQLGLNPWYLDGDFEMPGPTIPIPSPAPVPSLTPPSPSPSPVPSPSPPVPVPSPTPPSPSPSPVPSPSPPVPVPSPTPPSPSPSPPVPISPVAGISCSSRVDISGVWPTGSEYATVLNVYIQNTGSSQLQVPWGAEITGGSYSYIMSTWNWDASVENGIIKGQASDGWLALYPNQEANIGLIVAGPTTSFQPSSVKVNGQECALKVSTLSATTTQPVESPEIDLQQVESEEDDDGEGDDSASDSSNNCLPALKYIANLGGHQKFVDLVHAARLKKKFNSASRAQTILVPTDEAMDTMLQTNGITIDDLKQNKEKLRQLVGNHLILYAHYLNDFKVGEEYLTFNPGSALVPTTDISQIINEQDMNTCQTVIHSITSVLVPTGMLPL
eukprot:jgi/Picsp_1/3181/NSC_06021-R1_cellulase